MTNFYSNLHISKQSVCWSSIWHSYLKNHFFISDWKTSGKEFIDYAISSNCKQNSAWLEQSIKLLYKKYEILLIHQHGFFNNMEYFIFINFPNFLNTLRIIKDIRSNKTDKI